MDVALSEEAETRDWNRKYYPFSKEEKKKGRGTDVKALLFQRGVQQENLTLIFQ